MKTKDYIMLTCLLALGGIVAFLYLRKDSQIIPVPVVSTLEKRIETQKELIPQITTQIKTDKKLVDSLSRKISEINEQLKVSKQKHDTVLIIKEQDKLITELFKESQKKDCVITNLDKLVGVQEIIIKNQDTLILVDKAQIKKLKRQRNIAILTTIVAGVVAIIK